ncbi:unnamed protein product [Leptidea sinapis]|uniref:Uncharacterized protein n=1 Tax=Leptidea sinapis TaxID=189913 RepID=A0A5E4QMP3_9NEOP|nr:unnamed protein product [Leptidea sinapis]
MCTGIRFWFQDQLRIQKVRTLGFEQSLTNQDPSRRRSTNVKNGAPSIIVDSNNRQNGKQETCTTTEPTKPSCHGQTINSTPKSINYHETYYCIGTH